MKKIIVSETWLYRYRFWLGYCLLAFTVIVASFYRLGTLLPGINGAEAATAASSMNIGALAGNPVDFGYHLIQYATISILGPTALAIRLPGVIISLVSIALFFYIVYSRFSKRAAVVTTFLLATSSWYLNYVRLGTSSSLAIFFVLLLIFAAIRLDGKYRFVHLLTLVSAAALSLYTPYFFYILVAGVLFSIPSIRRHLKFVSSRDLSIAIGLFVVLTLPLIYSVIQDFEIAKHLLAIPSTFPTPMEYWNNTMSVMGHVLWSSKSMPILHLGTLPMLEIFSVSMVALGLYHYDHELSKNLSRIILGGLLTVVLLLGVNADQLDYALILPFVYFLLAGGLVILFTQWNEIFPKNPLARIIAIIPISILLIIVIGYHTERYFIAWPNTPEVVAQHSEAYTKLGDILDDQSADTTVLIAKSEEVVMSPLEKYYEDSIFTAEIIPVEDAQKSAKLIITNQAYKELVAEEKKALGKPSRTISGQYPSQSTVLWVFER